MSARQSRSTVATIVLLVLAATSAGAHPGHGATPSSAGVLHYLSEPVHVLPWLLSVAMVVVVVAWRRRHGAAARRMRE